MDVDEILEIAQTEDELRDLVDFLIQHRTFLRDAELDRLKREADELLGRLEDVSRRQVLEEIRCFKDVLALQKRSLQDG